jgi:hypothetical protein
MRPTQIPIPARLAHLTRDPRGYPVIATVSRGTTSVDFGALSERRKLALATFDWCAVCGLPFGDEPRWQVVAAAIPADRPLDEGGFGEAPVHEICAVYAAQACPHLSSPGARLGDMPRKGQVREPTIQLMGFTRTAGVEAFESVLQRGTFVLHFFYHQAEQTGSLAHRRPQELADHYQELLAAETIPATTPAERELISLFNEVSNEDGGTVAGAALMAGAAFARDIFRVQGISQFNRQIYRTMAAGLLLDETAVADVAATFEDPAGRAVAEWLLERGDDLPRVLSQWRRAARRQIRLHNPQRLGQRPAGHGSGNRRRAARRRK